MSVSIVIALYFAAAYGAEQPVYSVYGSNEPSLPMMRSKPMCATVPMPYGPYPTAQICGDPSPVNQEYRQSDQRVHEGVDERGSYNFVQPKSLSEYQRYFDPEVRTLQPIRYPEPQNMFFPIYGAGTGPGPRGEIPSQFHTISDEAFKTDCADKKMGFEIQKTMLDLMKDGLEKRIAAAEEKQRDSALENKKPTTPPTTTTKALGHHGSKKLVATITKPKA